MARGQLLPGAFLLHQSAERYFHTATLVLLAYKYRTHKLDDLIKECHALDPRLAQALPRAQPHDKHLFELLRRAYIEARYNPKYRITRQELAELRQRVQTLATHVHTVCAEHMTTLCGPDAMGPLLQPPVVGDLPELPAMPEDLGDAAAVEQWMQTLIDAGREQGVEEGRELGVAEGEQRGEERGRQLGVQEGRELGVAEGEQRGRELGVAEGRALALLDILAWRGITLTPSQRDHILQCDAPTLQRYWHRARTAQTPAELFAEEDAK